MIKAVGEVTDLPQEALRPAGLILACPLINVLGAYQALQATGSAKLEKTAPFMAAILLGDKPVDRQALEALSPHLHIKADTPACFIWTTQEDQRVPAMDSLLWWAQAMAAQKRPLELHFYEGGTPRSGYGRLC